MKTKKIIYIFMILAALLFAIETADACSLNPTAVMTTEPDGTVFYNDELVLLSGQNSVANCGFITEYRWLVSQIGGGGWQQIYVGSSPTYNYTFPFLEDGESEKAYYLQLAVRNSSDKYHTSTIQVTITRDNKSFYYLTDHLGSVRVTVDERGDPVGWDDYYPFGLQMPDRHSITGGQEPPLTDVKFTGHELNQEGQLGIYHAGARLYDPAVGRFMSIDPMNIKYFSTTPYHYVLNNPLRFIDPTGQTTIIDEDGYVIEVWDDGSTAIFKMVVSEDRITYTNVGKTLMWDSFLDSEGNPTGTIDIGSYWAQNEIDRALTEVGGRFYTQYAPNAYGDREYDIKTKSPDHDPYYGSQLYEGLYVSARDAGNILAGAAANQGGLGFKNAFTGFGALQIGQEISAAVGLNRFGRIPEVAIGGLIYTSAMQSPIGLAYVPYFGEERKSHIMQIYGYFMYRR